MRCIKIFWKAHHCWEYNDDVLHWHCNNAIMGAMASQITSLTIVYSTVYSRRRSKKASKVHVTGLCGGNSPVTGEFIAQRANLHTESLPEAAYYSWCVFLTLTGLISAWRRGEASSAILAKPLSDYVTVLCLRQCKSRHLKVCEILKKYILLSNKLNNLHSWLRCAFWCCKWRRPHVLLLFVSSSNFSST